MEKEISIQKRDDETYKNYFGNHKKEFRNILAKYTDIEYVREHNWGSIWIDEELVDIMKTELERLDRFLMLMKQQPGLKVYFYDSY